MASSNLKVYFILSFAIWWINRRRCFRHKFGNSFGLKFRNATWKTPKFGFIFLMIFSSVQSLHSQKSKIRKSEIKRKNEVSAFVLKLKYRFIVNLSEAAIFFWKKSKFARASRVQWFKSDNFTLLKNTENNLLTRWKPTWFWRLFPWIENVYMFWDSHLIRYSWVWNGIQFNEIFL